MSDESKSVVKADHGHAIILQREEFGAVERQQVAETAAVAVAAREQAAINARFLMAERHPRNVENFRTLLLKECQRPGFADAAEYDRPAGKKLVNGRWIEQRAKGPSIRFIETAMCCWKNIYPEVTTVFDSPELRICRATVTDLESNIAWSMEVQVTKRIERKGYEDKRTGKMLPPKGREILGERINSLGETTYLVRATDDEVLMKQNALLSKSLRTSGKRLLPADIVEECMEVARQTRADHDAKDPDAAKRKLIDGFNGQGVTPEELEEYLGHGLEKLQPKEITELRGLFTALRDGNVTWEEAMLAKNPTGSAEAAEDVAAKKLAGLRKSKKDKGKTKAKKDETAPTETPAPTPPSPETAAEESVPLTKEQMDEETKSQLAREHESTPPHSAHQRLQFGRKP